MSQAVRGPDSRKPRTVPVAGLRPMSPLFHCGLLGDMFYNGTDAGPGGPTDPARSPMFCGHQSSTRTLDRSAEGPDRRPVDPSTRVTDHERQATIDQLRLHTGV